MTDPSTTALDLTIPDEADSVELLIEGDEDLVHGYVRGLLVGMGSDDWPVFNSELGIGHERISKHLKELVGLAEHLTHVIVPARSVEAVIAGLIHPRCNDMDLRGAHPILSAGFGFRFAVFTEEMGQKVSGLFGDPPAGVAVLDYEPEEIHRADDTVGDELYTVVHDFKLSGAGEVEGAFRGVLAMHERARRIEQVQEGALRLHLGELLPGTGGGKGR